MSNEGKSICPLCMEEMDLTDRQLKPCECGYEICLWCWHHIMEIAEKDGTDGQCPACRNTYDKERIMTMTISSERKRSSKKKHKIQKDKPKAPELRKDLENVRVIMRNLVYMAGIPNKLANEETLCKKEYLGQYGKILKVYITRPAEVHHQAFPDSCIVYVTFSKEEEALQCIQSINGFVLDGYPLKACFGTTRYCHIWLKNLSCNNPNCFFIHGTVPQEDICTKEEVAAACTSKVQQCSGTALNSFQQCPSHKNIQRRSGSTLPAPEGNYQSCAEKTLVPSVTPKHFGGDKNSRSDYETSNPLSGAFPCGSTITSGKASYASVAVSQGRLKTSDAFKGLVTPSSGAEAQSREETQSNKQILTSGSHTEPLNGFVENLESSRSSSVGGYHVKAVPNFKAGLGNNIETKDTVADSSRHASSRSLCSTTGGATENPATLNRDIREPFVMSRQKSLVANLRAMNIGYVDASPKVPCYNWSSGCSELVNSGNRYGQEFGGIPSCDTDARTGKPLNKFSAYSAAGNGVYVRDEQEMSHNQYSAFGSRDMLHRSEHLTSSAKNMVKCVGMHEDGGFSEKFSMGSKNLSAGLANHLMYPKNLTLSNAASGSQSFDDFDFGDSTAGTSSEPRQLPCLRKPASSVSQSEALTAPKIPPGFYPKHTEDRGQSCSRPLTSDTSNTASSCSYFSLQPIDSAKRVFGGETLQPNNRLPLQLKAVESDNSLFSTDQSNCNSVNYKNNSTIPKDSNSQFNGQNDVKFLAPNSWFQ